MCSAHLSGLRVGGPDSYWEYREVNSTDQVSIQKFKEVEFSLDVTVYHNGQKLIQLHTATKYYQSNCTLPLNTDVAGPLSQML